MKGIWEETKASSQVSLNAEPEFKSPFCPQNLELVPSRSDLWTPSYKIFMAVNRDSFYTNGINRRESTHPYRIPFALLVNLKKIVLGFIYFILPLSSASQKLFWHRFEKKLIGGRNEAGRSKPYLFKEHRSRLRWWKLFAWELRFFCELMGKTICSNTFDVFFLSFWIFPVGSWYSILEKENCLPLTWKSQLLSDLFKWQLPLWRH